MPHAAPTRLSQKIRTTFPCIIFLKYSQVDFSRANESISDHLPDLRICLDFREINWIFTQIRLSEREQKNWIFREKSDI